MIPLPMARFCALACILCCSVSIIRAENLVLKGDELYPLGLHMDIWEDTQGVRTIEEVSSRQWASLFKRSEAKYPDFHMTSSVIWIRLNIENRHASEHWYLELGEPWLDDVALYVQKPSGRFTARHTGCNFPFGQREIAYANFVFPLELPKNQTQTLYLRVANNSKLRIEANLHTPEHFIRHTDRLRFGMGLFFGIMLVMILYNFFIFLSVRDVSYLYYVLYTAFMTLYLFVHRGYAFQYLWPDYPAIQNRTTYTFLGLALLTCCFFTHSYLQTARHTPLLHRLIWFQACVAGVLILLGVLEWNAMSFRLGTALGATMPATLFIGGFLCWRRGYRPARYFLFAWTLMLFGSFLFTLRNMGFLGESLFTEYGMYFGSAAEIVLLSLGLADRINALEREHLDRIRRVDQLKDQFLANTSHELRTPLNGIIGLAESLKEGATGKLPQKTRDILNMIITSGRRLHHLVNDILDFSKLKNRSLKLQLNRVDPHALTEVVLAVCGPLAGGKQLSLHNNIPLDAPAVTADENRLQQILYNLIGNAIKFTDAGSVQITADRCDNQLAISVTDTGVGIDPRDHHRIFDFFEQADLETSVVGTGIGLAVTRQLVELHGGNIEVKSQPGEGSCFTFSLPIAKGGVKAELETRVVDAIQWEMEEETEEDLVPTMLLGKQGRENPADFTLLIVDDEHINRQVLIHHLALSGFKTVEALNGPQALQKIRNEGPFDLVILDVMMPKMSGLEVCQTLRKEHPPHELPIILLTALDRKADLGAGFDAGANDYLTKPTSRVELLARVKIHLDLLIAYRTLESRVAARTRELESRFKALRGNTDQLKDAQSQLEALDRLAQVLRDDHQGDAVSQCLLDQGLALFERSQKGLVLLWDEKRQVFQNRGSAGFHTSTPTELTRSELTAALGRSRQDLSQGIYKVDRMGENGFGASMPKSVLVMELPPNERALGFILWDYPQDEPMDLPLLQRFRLHASNALMGVLAFEQTCLNRERTQEEAQQAQSLKTALLPDSVGLKERFKDYFAIARHPHPLSGNFYWTGETGQAQVLAVVSGPSGPAGLALSIWAMKALNGWVQLGMDQPEKLMARLFQNLKGIDAPLAVGFCSIHKTTGAASFCGTDVSLFGVTGGKAFHRKGMGEATHPMIHEVSTSPGDALFLAADSLILARNAEGQQFGVRRLTTLLESMAEKNMEAQEVRLLEELANHLRVNPHNTDLTVFAIRT